MTQVELPYSAVRYHHKAMLTGKALGEAIAQAIEKKGVAKADVARHFGVKPPSVQDWINRGTIDKGRLQQLWQYFGDVVGPEHWGLAPATHQDERVSFSRVFREPAADYENARRAPTLQPILSWEHEEDLPDGEFVLIPRLDIHLSAGHGRDQVEIEFAEKAPIAFRADWIRKKRLKPSKLAAMAAIGDSMEDRIHDGDLLAVDTSQTEVIDGKVYALWYEGGERVKRLYRMPGGGLRIHSDNDSRYPDIVLPPADLEHVRIIGRVVHIAGEGGL